MVEHLMRLRTWINHRPIVRGIVIMALVVVSLKAFSQVPVVEEEWWLIKEQVSISKTPSVKEHALKIPDELIDTKAKDQKVLRTRVARKAVAKYVADKYKIDDEKSLRVVEKATIVGREAGLDPTLILAVIAVESSFQPHARSKKGAQGLMQVMPRMHDDKYRLFGEHSFSANIDVHLRVGTLILREYIARAGSLHGGLRWYVGASHPRTKDGGYGRKVLAERARLKEVAKQLYT